MNFKDGWRLMVICLKHVRMTEGGDQKAAQIRTSTLQFKISKTQNFFFLFVQALTWISAVKEKKESSSSRCVSSVQNDHFQ